jgi:hypothetical protein
MTISGIWVMSIYGVVPVGSGCDAHCVLLPTGVQGYEDGGQGGQATASSKARGS